MHTYLDLQRRGNFFFQKYFSSWNFWNFLLVMVFFAFFISYYFRIHAFFYLLLKFINQRTSMKGCVLFLEFLASAFSFSQLSPSLPPSLFPSLPSLNAQLLPETKLSKNLPTACLYCLQCPKKELPKILGRAKSKRKPTP